MSDFSFRFKIINPPAKPENLEVALMRSLRVQIKPRPNRDNLIELKRARVGDDGWVGFSLSEDEIASLREGRHKVIHLALSIERGKTPLFVSGTMLLAKVRELGDFAIDLKKQELITNFSDNGSDTDTSNSNTDTHDGKVPTTDNTDREPASNTGKVTGLSIGERTELSSDFRERTRDDLVHARSPRLIGKIESRRKNRAYIRKLMLDATAKQRKRNPKSYVAPKTDASQTLLDNMNAGLSQLQGSAWRGMALHLTEEYLDGIGLKLDNGWSRISPESWTLLREKLAAPTVAKRRNRLLEACRKKKTAEKFMETLDAGDETTTDTVEEPVVNENAPTVELEAIYRDLCSELSAQINIAARPDVADVNASIETQLAPGPADTTAYYDYHTLHIAWDDTWTSVYDDYTEKEVAKVYDEIVQKVGSEVADVIENTEYNELLEFLDDLRSAADDSDEDSLAAPPADLVAWMPDVRAAWSYLSDEDRLYLMFLLEVVRLDDKIQDNPILTSLKLQTMKNVLESKYSEAYADSLPNNANADFTDWAVDKAENLLSSIDYEQEPQNFEFGRLGRMLDGIHTRLYGEPYAFDIFVPDSYNYGLVHTYQQSWKPLQYQVGDLISTMPLAPGEKKTYTLTEKIASETSSTQTASRSSKSSSDQSSTMRSQADIVAKAMFAAEAATKVDTNFTMKFKLFGGSVKGSTSAAGSTSSESQSTKQNIRESTLNAAQEYTDERKLEVTEKSERSSEAISTSEISNPNNEITVTYLFYELQRRFEVTSRLDRLTPVVLVAFDVPQPSEIDEDWLLTYDWILRKALLDPKLAAGLDYIRKGLTGDEISVEIYRAQWEVQASVVRELSANLKVHTQLRDISRQALQNASELVADKFGLGDAVQLGAATALPALGGIAGPIGVLAGVATGGLLANDAISSSLTKDEIAAAQESARLGLEWANTDYQEAYNSVKEAVYALETATKAYADAIAMRQKMRTIVDQLRIHVKENILYYMQVIWAHEPSDQRYFRIYDNEVIWPRAAGLPQARAVEVPVDPALVAQFELLQEQFDRLPFMDIELQFPEPEIVEKYPTRQLHEVADLDNLMGFKGNYAIFPLKNHNAVTNYMAQGFLDDYFGLNDPDGNGALPTETEALEIAECMWRKAGEDEAKRRFVVRWLTDVLDRQIMVSDEITVPSGQLFIEALPGAHPLLEDFKLRHRAVDLEKARQELIDRRVETIRKVQRLLGDDLSDPDIDKKIMIEGGSANVIVSDE